MYDHQEAADFVANMLEYEVLENATKPPSCLPSPSQVYICKAGILAQSKAPSWYIYATPLTHYECSSIVLFVRQVLKWGTGDSFDFAVLLTSYLTGVGYNAYVVHGYAPAHITLRDQSHIECPVLSSGLDDPFAKRSSTSANSMMMTMKRGEGNNSAAADDRAQNKYGENDSSNAPSYGGETKARPCTESKYLKVSK